MSRLRMRSGSCLMGLVFIAGCGASDAPTLAPVDGTVTFLGQPLPDGMIVFHPETGRSATGKIRDGKIVEVSTTKENDGAPIGNCKVTIAAIAKNDDMYADPESMIPERYGNPETSTLTATIKSGGPNTLSFELKN